MWRKVLLGVGPWVVFSMVLRFGTVSMINMAWIAFFLLHTYFGRYYLKSGNPMSWVSSLLFLFLFANSVFEWSYFALQYGVQICYGTFALTAFVTVLANKPFTLTHSKLTTPSEFWQHPVFLKTNKIVALYWSFCFAVNGVVMMFEYQYPWATLLTTYVMLASAIIFSDRYPEIVKNKALEMRKRAELLAQQQGQLNQESKPAI